MISQGILSSKGSHTGFPNVLINGFFSRRSIFLGSSIVLLATESNNSPMSKFANVMKT
jgi:hypothetical protein